MKQLIRYLIWFLPLFAGFDSHAQNNTVYGAGISYTNGVPSWAPNPRTSRAAVDTVTGRWYHFNTPGGWQWIGNTVEEISGCAAPAYTPDKGDSRLVINNCVKPQVFWYDGASWKWINQGEVYTAGQGIRIESNTIILDSLYVLRFRTGSNTDGAAGAMSWNATEETVDLVTDQGAVTGHLMESAYYNTRNTTGTPITIGTVVMANGTTGNTGRILIAPAIADGSVNSEYILGLAAQTIGNNSNGKVQHFGKIRGIQTNGANFGETWVDGDVLYCSASTPGYLTKVLPTAPNLKIPIAIVIHAHPSNGTLFVRPSHFPDLAQINDVQLSSPTNGQVLTYNSTLSRWENATPVNQLQTLSTDGSAGNISISSGNTITLNVNDADASATNELQSLSVAANTATLSNSGGSVTIAGAGINTVGTAGTTITVTGTEVDGSTTNELQTLSTGTNTLTLSNGGGTVTVDTDPSTDVTGSGAAGRAAFWTGAQTQSSNVNFAWDNVNSRLGIKRGAPAFDLDVNGGGRFIGGAPDAGVRIDGGTNSFFRMNAGVSIAFFSHNFQPFSPASQDDTAIPSWYWRFGGGVGADFFDVSRSPAGSTSMTSLFRLNGAGNLGINQSAPAARLHVVGSGASSTTWTAQFHNSAGNNNALMIRDDGNVGIGTNSPSRLLTVAGDAFINNRIIGLGVGNATSNTFFCSSIGASFTGTHTVAIGALQLPNITTASGNVLIGSGAGNNLTTGNSNTYIGRDAGALNQSALVNFGLGAFALLNHTTGDNNIAIGFDAGRRIVGGANMTNSSTSIYIGNDTRPLSNSQFNQIVIGDGAVGLGTNTTRVGNTNTIQTHLSGSLTIGDTTLDPSAVLDVSSTTKGVLFPRMTTAQRDLIATPADGLVIYNTSTNKLQVRAGGAWVDLH